MDNVVSIMFRGYLREFYHNTLELLFANGDYAVIEEVVKVDIFRDPVYIKYPTEEWRAVKLDEFINKFSSVSSD